MLLSLRRWEKIWRNKRKLLFADRLLRRSPCSGTELLRVAHANGQFAENAVFQVAAERAHQIRQGHQLFSNFEIIFLYLKFCFIDFEVFLKKKLNLFLLFQRPLLQKVMPFLSGEFSTPGFFLQLFKFTFQNIIFQIWSRSFCLRFSWSRRWRRNRSFPMWFCRCSYHSLPCRGPTR